MKDIKMLTKEEQIVSLTEKNRQLRESVTKRNRLIRLLRTEKEVNRRCNLF